MILLLPGLKFFRKNPVQFICLVHYVRSLIFIRSSQLKRREALRAILVQTVEKMVYIGLLTKSFYDKIISIIFIQSIIPIGGEACCNMPDWVN